jgi:alkylhydroperoxidase/carboxymuconolactone decarboxylase family protein
MVNLSDSTRTLALFQELGLVSADESRAVLSVLAGAFPFVDVLRAAESIHVHGRVDDVSAMPHARILEGGGVVENQRDGYVKYAFPGGTNMIYSSIDIAQDDLLGERAGLPPRPFVDHVGVDLRRETPEMRALFDAVPARARDLGWRHVPQGDDGKAVYCCHTSVRLKHWVYPDDRASFRRPIEFAYGALTIHAGKMGCDLRPIDPAHPRAAEVVGCCGSGPDVPAHTDGNGTGTGYYDRGDLARFSEVGRFATASWKKFFAYYEEATQSEGALGRREKALIALAVAHSKQCPYCIDAYTASCLEAGATVEQMHEAVHVAAAMAAGIDLAHATQMHNALRRRGALPGMSHAGNAISLG